MFPGLTNSEDRLLGAGMSGVGLLLLDGCAESKAEMQEALGQPQESKQPPLPSNGLSFSVCGRKMIQKGKTRAIGSICHNALKPGF